jgi:guanine deaminase
VFGHCIHFDDDDFRLMHERKARIAHCPSSNLFLGSGLFKMKQAKQGEYPVKVGLGTDLGAGTSFSQLMSLEESYKIAQLQGETLTALQGYYLATRGGADSLDLSDKIGSIEVGMEADFAVWDLHSTDLIDYRMRFAETLEEKLFVQMMIADDRSVRATFVAGKKIYDRDKVYYLG